MYYGHGSWVVLVVFGVMFALRAFSHRSRPDGRPGPAQRSSFTSAAPPAGSPGAADPAPDPPPSRPGRGGMGVTAFTGVAPGWLADPSGRHQLRYWSGTEWTDHVSDDGVPGSDPPPGGLRP